jgi:hypothetical protein
MVGGRGGDAPVGRPCNGFAKTDKPCEGRNRFVTNLSVIATTADGVRDDLLRLAKQIPNSPARECQWDDVALTDRKLASRRDGWRPVSIADAMRHDAPRWDDR